MKGKKGVLSLYVGFFILAVIIIVIAAILAPMGVLFNTEMYKAGETIYKEANSSIQGIQDDEARNSIENTINGGFSSVETNINVNNDIFQYSWIFITILTGVVVFVGARRITEVNRGVI